MENKIDKYYFKTKNNNEYILYFIQTDVHNYEIYFDLKDNEFDGVKYKSTNLFESNYALAGACQKIDTSLYRYPCETIFRIKIINKQFKYIYDYIVENNGYCLFYDVEIKDDYMIFIRNDVTIP